MDKILMAIQPKWVEKILRGEKTVEIRKTIPKCEPPFVVFIYCTKAKPLLWVYGETFIEYLNDGTGRYDQGTNYTTLNGKIVGKFMVNKIEEFDSSKGNPNLYVKACIGDTEVAEYGKGKKLFAYHISDFVAFNEPDELSELENLPKSVTVKGWKSIKKVQYKTYPEPLTKAPQDWCYVEETK